MHSIRHLPCLKQMVRITANKFPAYLYFACICVVSMSGSCSWVLHEYKYPC